MSIPVGDGEVCPQVNKFEWVTIDDNEQGGGGDG